jgi:electron transfer flavoprotein alpha subunit
MSDVKRINPRRPFRITADGIRRIVVGDTSQAPEPGAEAASAQSRPKRRRTCEAPAAWNMAIAHSDRGRLDDHARQALAAAAILAAPTTGVLAIVLGPLSEDLALAGADLVAVLPECDSASYDQERDTANLVSLIRSFAPQHIFMPDKADGDGDLGRRLIVELGVSGAAHVTELNATSATIPWSGGAGIARTALPRIVLLDPGTVDTNLPYTGAGQVLDATELPPPGESPASHGRDQGLEATNAAQIPLEEADFIVSAGNGVANIATLTSLAEALGAAVGASRVAVDDGKFARAQQIGATGKTVAATTYIAIGISGAVQHLQGIKDCRHVIALNRDAGAPIIKRADLSIIGDAEEVMQALLELIRPARAAAKLKEAAEWKPMSPWRSWSPPAGIRNRARPGPAVAMPWRWRSAGRSQVMLSA